MKSKELGNEGEKLACRLLARKGYRILTKNYRSPWGEIDIIARDGNDLVFIEVKTRRSKQYGVPQDAVTVDKQNKMRKGALSYMNNHKYEGDCRFDVMSILANFEGKATEVELLENAF